MAAGITVKRKVKRAKPARTTGPFTSSSPKTRGGMRRANSALESRRGRARGGMKNC